MSLFAFSLGRSAKTGAVKTVFALEVFVIVILDFQDKIAQSPLVLLLNSTTLPPLYVLELVPPVLIKIYTQELAFHALLHVINVVDILMCVHHANLQ
jgi:hypothetical protein